MRPHALIFDFDGTILDTETHEFDVWAEIYTQHGAILGLQEWGRGVGTWDAFDPFAHLEDQTESSLNRDALHAQIRREVLARIEVSQPMPGVVSTLEAAKHAGVRLAIASSSDRAWVGGWLEKLGLHGFFESLSTRDDVQRVKPDPELYVLAANRLELEPATCIAVEDSPNGCKAALAAGMRVIAVPNPVTRTLEFPAGVHRMDSLDLPFEDLLARLSR